MSSKRGRFQEQRRAAALRPLRDSADPLSLRFPGLLQAALPLQAEKAASPSLAYPLLSNRGCSMLGAGVQADVCHWVTFREGTHFPVNLNLLRRLVESADERLSLRKAL